MKPLCLSLLVSTAASAQSAALVEILRERPADALSMAQKEWVDCHGRKCPERDKLSLLVGYLELSSGDAAAAAVQLSSAPAPAGLEAFHAYYLGEALFFSRQYVEAAAAFERAASSAPDSLRRRAQGRLGESLLQAQNPARALEILLPLVNEESSAELLYARGAAAESLGRKDAARADKKNLLLRYPSHPLAEQIYPSVRASLSADERLQHARALLDAGRAESALSELDDLNSTKKAQTPLERAQRALVRAMALFAVNQDASAESCLAQAKGWPPSVRAEALFLRARRALKQNDRPTARRLMLEIVRKYPQEHVADESLYLVAWVHLQEGHLKEAVSSFDAFLSKFPASRKRDEALWFKSLALIRQKAFPKAQKTLDELARSFPNSSLVPQAHYWAARVRQLAGQKSSAWASAYSQVISEAPASFYALLASLRLKAAGQSVPPLFPEPPKPLAVAPLPSLELTRSLIAVGLLADAEWEVAAQTSAVKPDQALSFAHALQQLGEFGLAYQVGLRHLWAEALTSKQPEALAVLYPKAYAQSVEAAAKQNGVDPFLVWAIMRRESAFRPEAMSSADARGLMQLILPTATQVASRLKLTLQGPEDLFAPSLNVGLGSWYLGSLVKRFVHPTLVAAAYNAGPKPVARWAEERKQLELDLFVETIPFKETRGYVKQVVADYYLYQAFYGEPGKQPELALSIPEPHREGVEF